jgi:hypothetical protein
MGSCSIAGSGAHGMPGHWGLPHSHGPLHLKALGILRDFLGTWEARRPAWSSFLPPSGSSTSCTLGGHQECMPNLPAGLLITAATCMLGL